MPTLELMADIEILKARIARLEAALKGLSNFAGRAAGQDYQELTIEAAWMTVSENAADALKET